MMLNKMRMSNQKSKFHRVPLYLRRYSIVSRAVSYKRKQQVLIHDDNIDFSRGQAR